jgi:hypothetical protein
MFLVATSWKINICTETGEMGVQSPLFGGAAGDDQKSPPAAMKDLAHLAASPNFGVRRLRGLL